jgi:hypothetical protein
MSYLVTVSFDLKNAKTEDYGRVYDAFKSLALHKQIKADNGVVVQLPTTTCVGYFDGVSASAVRDDLANRTQAAVEQLGLSGEVFVAVGGDWSWARRLPKAASASVRW